MCKAKTSERITNSGLLLLMSNNYQFFILELLPHKPGTQEILSLQKRGCSTWIHMDFYGI